VGYIEPPAESRGTAEPLVRGAKPSEAETLLAFGRSMKAANLPTFLTFGKTENHMHS